MNTSSTARSSARGFTLIEVVVVLMIFTVVIAMVAVMTRGVTAAQKRSLTATRMAAMDAALAQFVSQQKRLPCPADGTITGSGANAGLEQNRNATGCTGNQQDGVVPWRSLGLTEGDATDGWDRRFTYRVGPLLAADNGMNLSWCDSAGDGNATGATFVCNDTAGVCINTNVAACTSVLKFLTRNVVAPAAVANGKGLTVKSIAGQVLMNPNPNLGAAEPHTGAAYVLISHGESGGGGYLNSGVLGVSSSTDGTEEMKNYASLAFVNNAVTYYVDDSTSDVAGATHFDDVMTRPSILAVAARAGLGPRAH